MSRKLFQIVAQQSIQKQWYRKASVRVRFAPSPTGYLHLGGLRTALYNYLFARKHNGVFILRIEDTDQTRLEPGAMEKLHEDLVWAGIIPDEDPVRGGPKAPYVQSKRLDIYHEHIDKLLENGSAYQCFCSERRLEMLRREAVKNGEIPKYDNRCRDLDGKTIRSKLARGEPYCVRFKLPQKTHSFNDLVYGSISLNREEGDPVILKADKYPTYHFANVVDDHCMEITHVLRGVEWQVSTPKHLALYEAFEWQPPQFGHLPLILNSDGTKLSKRQGDIRVESYRKNGILPLALINYITYSGGGFNREEGYQSRCHSYEDLIDQFEVTKINKNSSRLHADKLIEFNRMELSQLIADENNIHFLAMKVQRLVAETFPERIRDQSLQLDEHHIVSVLRWASNRITSLNDLVSKDLAFLWVVPSTTEARDDNEKLGLLQNLCTELTEWSTNNFERQQLNDFLKKFAQERELKYPTFMKLLRTTLSGLDHGPGVAEMMEILGKDKTLDRLRFSSCR